MREARLRHVDADPRIGEQRTHIRIAGDPPRGAAIRADLQNLKCALLPERFDGVRVTDFTYVLSRNGVAEIANRCLTDKPTPAGERLLEAAFRVEDQSEAVLSSALSSEQQKRPGAINASGLLCSSGMVVRGRVELPTFRFSGVAIALLLLDEPRLEGARRRRVCATGGGRCRQRCRHLSHGHPVPSPDEGGPRRRSPQPRSASSEVSDRSGHDLHLRRWPYLSRE